MLKPAEPVIICLDKAQTSLFTPGLSVLTLVIPLNVSSSAIARSRFLFYDQMAGKLNGLLCTWCQVLISKW